MVKLSQAENLTPGGENVVGVLTLAFKDCFAHVQTDKPVLSPPPSIDSLGVSNPLKHEINTLIKLFAPPPSHNKQP